MQRIDIRGGYVEIKDVVTRKMSREYMAVLSDNAKLNEGKEVLTSKAINAASEYMVLAMINRVVIVAADQTETEIPATSEWLDELAERDFDTISKAVLAIFNDGREKAKK